MKPLTDDDAPAATVFTSLIRGLKRVADFYEKNYDKVNLDSIFGLRAAEGKKKTEAASPKESEQAIYPAGKNAKNVTLAECVFVESAFNMQRSIVQNSTPSHCFF